MPDMREKVIEYINELQEEIDRCTLLLEEDIYMEVTNQCLYSSLVTRIQTIVEIKNDLKNRLEELI